MWKDPKKMLQSQFAFVRSGAFLFFTNLSIASTSRFSGQVLMSVTDLSLRSPREIRQGEDIAWYADGETIVRNEHNPTTAYAYGNFFGGYLMPYDVRYLYLVKTD